MKTLTALLLIWFPLCSFNGSSEQAAKSNESGSPAECTGKLDPLQRMGTAKVSLAEFRYGEIPFTAEQVRTGKTAIDAGSLQAAVLAAARKAVQDAGFKLLEKDADWSLDVGYFNYFEKGEEKEDAGKITFTVKPVKKLELTFTTNATGTLCRSRLTPQKDVRVTMKGDDTGRIITEFDAQEIPQEIIKIVQGLIPNKPSTP